MDLWWQTENIQDLVLHLSTQQVCEGGGPKLRNYPDVVHEKLFWMLMAIGHVNCSLVMLDSSKCQCCM